MTRALVRVLQESGYFKHVTADNIITPEMLPAELRPGVVVMHERTRGVERIREATGRRWSMQVDLVLDIQGLARSNDGKEQGYNTSSMRDALVHHTLCVLANNPGLVIQLDEFGETSALQHAHDALWRWDVETIPVLPPLTRSLLRVTVLLDESLELRTPELWRFEAFEGAPLGGSFVENSNEE